MLANAAIDPSGCPGQLGQLIKSEIIKWAKVVKGAEVHVD